MEKVYRIKTGFFFLIRIVPRKIIRTLVDLNPIVNTNPSMNTDLTNKLKSRVADPGGVEPDPTLDKTPGSGSDRIKIILNF